MYINLKNKFYIKTKCKIKSAKAVLFLFLSTKNKNEIPKAVYETKFSKRKKCLAILTLLQNYGFNFVISFFPGGGGAETQGKLFEVCLHKALIRINKELGVLLPFSNDFDIPFKRKERKKAGLKKARKSPQYHKR